MNFIPVNSKFNNAKTKEDLQRFYRRVKLHSYFNDPDKHIQHDPTSEESIFNKHKRTMSSWTPSDIHPSIATFISRCDEDISRVRVGKQNVNLSRSGYQAIDSLKKNNNIVIKKADKGGAVVVWRKDLYIAEGTRKLSN